MTKTPDTTGSWMLIEIFGHTQDPTVIAVGQTEKPFTPLDKIVKSRTHRAAIRAVLHTIVSDDQPHVIDFVQHTTRYIFVPLTDFAGYTSAVLVHYADEQADVPTPPACGAWYFNVSDATAHGSTELLDMYRVPEDQRRTGRALHGAFQRLVGQDHEALRKLIDKKPGVTHQAYETVETDNGYRWIAHYSCRFVAHGDQIVLHGVTRQVGPYRDGTPAPDPFGLTAQLTQHRPIPGFYQMILDPRTGAILRTYDGIPVRVPQDAKDLTDLLADREAVADALAALQRVASTGQQVDDFPVTNINGRETRVRLEPILVGDATAVLASFRTRSIISPR